MKKVSLQTAKKMNKYRPGLQNKKTIAKQMPQNCFICDEDISEKGVLLLNNRTPYTKTELPTKIGQLMGDRFMVVVSAHDMLCKRCGALLNHLDKLESDLDIVRRALTGYLKMKYGLLDEDEDDLREYTTNKKNPDNIQRDEEIKGNDDIECLSSEQESPESESELDSISGRKGNKESLQMQLEEGADQNKDPDMIKIFKCRMCTFKTTDFSAFQPHYQRCCEVHLQCPMCMKQFESHKYIRSHFMEAHLSDWTCHFCNKKFAEESEFTSHMKTHLGRRFSTKVSEDNLHLESGSENESCDSSQNILGNYECNICNYQCSSKKIFDDHVRKHVVLKLFQCKVCKKRFESEEKLNQHMEEHPSEMNNEVNVEEKYKVSKEDASRETLLQDVGETIETNEQNSTTSVENVELKVENITIKSVMQNPEKNEIMFFTCHKCSLTFVSESLFKEHLKLHNEEETTKDLFCQDASALLQMEKVNLDEDSAEHDVNSLDSEAQQQYVEMDESLEDMFEKLHADTEKSVTETGCSEKSVMEDMFEKIQDGLEKSRADMECTMNTEGSTNASSLNCNIHSEEYVGGEELGVHKVTHMHSDTQEENPYDHCAIVNDKNFFHLADMKKKGSLSNQDPVMTLQSAITITDGQIPVDTLLSEDSRQQVENLTDATPIQSDENVKDTFLDIFNMVKEKKLSANDDAEIDRALLENLSNVEVKLEHEDSSSASLSALNLGSNVEPDVTNQASFGLSKRTYVCAICGFRTPILNELKRHFKEHKDKSFPCKICKTTFPTSQKLSSHLKCHEKFKGKMTCPYCYEEFPDKFSLQKHLQMNHQKDKVMYKCVFCNESFTTKKAFKAHEEVHPERFTYKCDECSQQFMKEKQLVDHKDSVHRDPHCRFCGKEITKLKTLRNHELRHIREKDNFECDVCKRVFKTKTGLRHHVAVHTGEYKFCCDYCGRGFMSRMMMEEHRSMHTKEERYICDVCGRKFSFQSTYWIHRKWHDNPYPYKCSFCGRMFRHSSLLAVHKRKHTGERPYKCPHCPLTFPVGGTLKRHLILHTGVYPFNCESCKRGFTTRHKYAAHLAKIHGDFELLNSKQPQNEFKMVVREDPVHHQTVWSVTEDPEHLSFKLESITREDDASKVLDEGIACTIVPDDMLVDNVVPTRVVKIVLDEASQAVATVTLAEHQTIQSILPDIWYQ